MVKELDGGLYEDIRTYGLRNGTLLAIAPTGTISLLMGSFSGGCEPLYKISYERSTHKMEEVNGSFRVYAHSVKDLLRYHHLPLTLTDDEIREKFPWVIESHDVSFMDRVAMQAVMQKYVDNSISSTVNLKMTLRPKISTIFTWRHGKADAKALLFSETDAAGEIFSALPQRKKRKPMDQSRQKGSRFVPNAAERISVWKAIVLPAVTVAGPPAVSYK